MTGADGKTLYQGQVYGNGESCGGSIRRQTTVYFECDKNAGDNNPRVTGMLRSAGEPEVCQYELLLASRLWCDLEAAGLAAPPPSPSPPPAPKTA